jgi:hypothetical protein
VADLGVTRSYQQEDVPEPQPSRRYQHDLHKARCACGKVHVAARPAGVPDAPLSVGPRLSAMAVYLSVFQHVPVERAQALIADLTGGVVSAGFVHSCLGKAAGLVADATRLIRTLIAASPVAGFDETTLRSGPAGDKKYVHGAFTELYSAFWLGTRSLETMRKAGILPFFAGIVVSDRYRGYYSETWQNFAGHQARAAHIIRDFQDCAETYPGAAWPEQAMRSLRGLIRAWHAAREQGLPAIPAEDREPLELGFRRAVTVGLAAVSRVPGPKNQVRQQPGRELLEFCKTRQADVLRFTTDTSVWPTNNLSERGVRPLKTQQKISGRLTSDDVTQDRLDIRGYIDTARKHGLGAYEVLRQLITGNPWLPQPGRSPRNNEIKSAPPSPTVNRGECLPLKFSPSVSGSLPGWMTTSNPSSSNWGIPSSASKPLSPISMPHASSWDHCARTAFPPLAASCSTGVASTARTSSRSYILINPLSPGRPDFASRPIYIHEDIF